NEPTVLDEKNKQDLSSFVGKFYEVLGEKVYLLADDEWQKLSITKGSLSVGDRQMIESHVTHTYKFLAQIPWTKPLKRVPEIAHSHHEKLDGTGYPQKLKAEQIPFESHMMAVTD